METNGYKLHVDEKDAHNFARWMKTGGGVAVWGNVYLGEDTRWSTPVLTNGVPTTKPNYKATNEPMDIITDAEEIEVLEYEEFKRIPLRLRVGSQGLSLKLTDADNRRVNKALAAAGVGATYDYDYFTQEAVVLRPTGSVSLAEWMQSHTN